MTAEQALFAARMILADLKLAEQEQEVQRLRQELGISSVHSAEDEVAAGLLQVVPERAVREVEVEPVARGRQMQQMVACGALGGGVLLAGFGLLPALAGMTVGALLAYWSERRAARQPTAPVA